MEEEKSPRTTSPICVDKCKSTIGTKDVGPQPYIIGTVDHPISVQWSQLIRFHKPNRNALTFDKNNDIKLNVKDINIINFIDDQDSVHGNAKVSAWKVVDMILKPDDSDNGRKQSTVNMETMTVY